MRILNQNRTLGRLFFTPFIMLFIPCVFVLLFGLQAVAQGLHWTELTSGSQPPPRMVFGMVYDSQRDRIVLHGGYREDINPDGSIEKITLSDTWEYDNSEWQLVSEDGPTVLAHGMAYDPIRGETVLFGGAVWNIQGGYWDFKRETWLWDGSTWTGATDPFGPSTRAHGFMTFDPESQSLILTGGNLGLTWYHDTWSWDGSNWTQLASEGPVNVAHGIAYNESRQTLTMSIGFDEDSYTMWEWDNNQWLLTDNGSQPTPLPSSVYNSFIYLPFMKKILRYGGGMHRIFVFPQDEVPDDDFWTWDGEKWEQVVLSPAPVKRMGHGGVYDSKRDRFMIFGGASAQNGKAYYLEDMWALSRQEPSGIDTRLWQQYLK